MRSVPAFDGAYFSGVEQEAVWDRFSTEHHNDRGDSSSYNIIKRA